MLNGTPVTVLYITTEDEEPPIFVARSSRGSAESISTAPEGHANARAHGTCVADVPGYWNHRYVRVHGAFDCFMQRRLF